MSVLVSGLIIDNHKAIVRLELNCQLILSRSRLNSMNERSPQFICAFNIAVSIVLLLSPLCALLTQWVLLWPLLQLFYNNKLEQNIFMKDKIEHRCHYGAFRTWKNSFTMRSIIPFQTSFINYRVYYTTTDSDAFIWRLYRSLFWT